MEGLEHLQLRANGDSMIVLQNHQNWPVPNAKMLLCHCPKDGCFLRYKSDALSRWASVRSEGILQGQSMCWQGPCVNRAETRKAFGPRVQSWPSSRPIVLKPCNTSSGLSCLMPASQPENSQWFKGVLQYYHFWEEEEWYEVIKGHPRNSL